MVEMFIQVVALKRRKSKRCVWEYGALFGVEAVHLEMLFGDLDELRNWWWKGDITEKLGVQLARQELDADFVVFD